MAVTIADLEINIRDNAQSTSGSLAQLQATVNRLALVITNATISMQSFSNDLRGVGKEANNAGKQAEKGSKGFGSFAKSVLRIMKYRAIRAVLKVITQGFREGIQNIAQYSAAIDGLDASKANQTMSAYASMGAQIKNSLGAAVMPLLANIMPMVQKIADLFMDAAEAIAKFFATLNGQATYTAANRDYWVDYAAGLDKSNKAAKELKRTILGFDEINALNSQSSGSSGSTTNYKDMFVEKTNDWFGLKDTFEWALTAVGAIGAAIAAWKISKAFTTSLAQVSSASQVIARNLLGLAAIGIGIYLSWGGGESFAAGDIKEGIIKSITGALSSALGGAMIGSTFGGHGALIGAIVGIGISLVTTAISYFVNKAKVDKQAFYENNIAPLLRSMGISPDQYTDEAIQGRMDANLELRTRISEITTEIDEETLTKLDMARQLINDIFMLNDKPIKTASEIEEIKRKIELLNGLKLDGIYLEWRDLDGVVGGTKEELLGVIDNMQKLAKQNVMMSALEEAFKAVWDANKVWEDGIRRVIELQNALKGATDEERNAIMDMLYAANTETEQYAKTLNEAKDKYIDVMKAIDDTVVVSRDGIVRVSDDVQKYLDNVLTDTTKKSKQAAKEIKDAFEPSNLLSNNLSTFKKQLESAFSMTISPTLSWQSSYTGNKTNIGMKASGGFVPSGDLFVAGEAGAELVMAAPGGSEVVNMAQFEAAMMNAVSMAGGNGGDWTIVVQDGNGNERSRQVITAAERANRRDGRTIIPVGVY